VTAKKKTTKAKAKAKRGKGPLRLTRRNYFSLEAGQEYMSASQFKGWLECPARMAATLAGEWEDEDKVAFAAGHYVEAAIKRPDTIEDVADEYRKHFYRGPTMAQLRTYAELNGKELPPKTPKSKLLQLWPEARTFGDATALRGQLDACAEKAKRDPLIREYMQGRQQVILTPSLFGIRWKCMLDVVNDEELRITDLKTSANLVREWRRERVDIFTVLARREGSRPKREWSWVPFYEAFDYWRSAAVYRAALHAKRGEWYSYALACVSKEVPPDVDVFNMRADETASTGEPRFDYELAQIEAALPQVLRWKSGTDRPPRCQQETTGDCAYCRSVKRARLLDARSVR
jgi:hypothetical protein